MPFPRVPFHAAREKPIASINNWQIRQKNHYFRAISVNLRACKCQINSQDSARIQPNTSNHKLTDSTDTIRQKFITYHL